jgi:MoaA/NifB/PqqE/SkfB family radical SAM enzyme
MDGIKEAKKLGIKTRIIFTIGKDNEGELDYMVELAKSLGVSLVVNARSFGGKTELELPVEYGKCRFPNIYLPIFPDGDILYLCMSMRLGNVKNVRLKDFLDSKEFNDFLIKASNCNKKCNFSCVKDGSLIYNLNIKKIINFLKSDFS